MNAYTFVFSPLDLIRSFLVVGIIVLEKRKKYGRQAKQLLCRAVFEAGLKVN